MSNSLNNSPDSYGKKVMVGAAFMVVTRFSIRLLGLVSVTILARLLTPEDFGVFGTAALVLAFFILLKEIGFGAALIKTENVTKDDIDTLWTMRLILGAITATALLLFSGVIADFLKEPRVIEVLRLMALIPIVDCLYSPASPFQVKAFKFGQNFLLKTIDKLVRVIAVIILAVTLQSYWALVYGTLLASFLGVIVSHIAMPYLPRLTLVNRQKYLAFSFWNYCRGLAKYLASSADEFVVRASENSSFFGIYHVSRDLSRVLIAELISPLGEALLPALVKFTNESERFRKAIFDTVGAYLVVGFAVSIGIVLTADEIVLILLGEQWAQAALFLALVAIGTACNSMGDINQSIFIAKDASRLGAIFWTIRAVVYPTVCIIAGLMWGAEGVAIAFSAASLMVLMIELKSLFSLVSAYGSSWLGLLVRPSIAGAIMIAGVLALERFTIDLWLMALMKVFVGGALYSGTILGLWIAAGKPLGPEYSLINRMPVKIKSLLIK